MFSPVTTEQLPLDGRRLLLLHLHDLGRGNVIVDLVVTTEPGAALQFPL
jgi:hypothetical protein